MILEVMMVEAYLRNFDVGEPTVNPTSRRLVGLVSFTGILTLDQVELSLNLFKTFHVSILNLLSRKDTKN